jgi:hypothetical protein
VSARGESSQMVGQLTDGVLGALRAQYGRGAVAPTAHGCRAPLVVSGRVFVCEYS